MIRLRPEERQSQSRCSACGTQLGPELVECPACHALVHASTLRSLAARAEELTASGNISEARSTWQRALELLPPGSRQHDVIGQKVATLARQLDDAPRERIVSDPTHPWWKRGMTAGAALIVLLVGKLKFLLLGLSKLKTLVSMFAFFGVYWTTFGWPLALGLVVSIYIHEMGHVAELKRLGIDASAPMFIPGVGAYVLLKTHIDDPVIDARVGLAGPLWGLVAGLIAYIIFLVSGAQVWVAIAELTGMINLFNLIPVWQLDGSRAFHALSRSQRWLIVIAIGVVFALTRVKFLILLGLVALYRAVRSGDEAGHRPTLLSFLVLLATLSWLSQAGQR